MKAGGPSGVGRPVRLRRRVWHVLTAPRDGGFTVIEVMIVLAVTGALFVSAAIMIAGRQNRTAFEQAVRNVHSQIQGIIDEVAIGHYSNRNDFSCTPGPGGPQIGPGSNGLGKNSGCIFLGKAIQFDVQGTDPEQFAVYTLAGLQKQFGTNLEAVNRATALPKVIEPANTTVQLESGLTTYDMWYNTGTGGNQPLGAVGFMTSLAKYSGTDIISGSQSVIAIVVPGTDTDRTTTETIQAINTNFPSGPFDPAGGISICFASGATDQSGLVTIGGTGRTTETTLSIRSNRQCAP